MAATAFGIQGGTSKNLFRKKDQILAHIFKDVYQNSPDDFRVLSLL